MKTHVKLEGKEVEQAIKQLEKLAVDTPEVCVMDTKIDEAITGRPDFFVNPLYEEWVIGYFGLTEAVDERRCARLISRSEVDLKDSDLYFEWFTEPNEEELKAFAKKIDEILKPLDVKYTVSNRK